MMNNGLQSHMGRVEICMVNKKCAAKDTIPITVPLEATALVSEVRIAVITSESANTPMVVLGTYHKTSL